MPPSTSSTPISIPTSSPIAIHRRDSSSDEDDDSDNNEGRRHQRTALNETDSLAELQVGSLPMHLRRRTRNSNNNGINGQYRRNNSSDQLLQFNGAMSLPPPRAPFLSARQDMESKLSSMPEIELPGSVASTDPSYLQSTPFGSLRESQFTHPHLDRWQQSNGSSMQQTTTQFQPQSLPAYAVSGSGGIGSFFPDSNDATSLERNTSTGSSGIGGLLEESRGGDNNNNNNYSRDFTNSMTNEYSQLALDGSGRPCAEGIGHGNTSFDDGRPRHAINDGNLSSSLTALDLLTRIRQTNAALSPPSQLEPIERNGDAPSTLNAAGPIEQQQLNGAQSNMGVNEQHDDPDMFEAFDFELDE